MPSPLASTIAGIAPAAPWGAVVIPAISVAASVLLVSQAVTAWRGFVAHDVDRGTRQPWTATRHAVLARETIARVLFFVLRPLGWNPRALPEDNGRPPVLLIPDPGASYAELTVLDVFLRHRGHATWPVHLPGKQRTLGEHAEHLREELVRLSEHHGGRPVDVVAYGVGGLAIAWVLHHLDGAPHVRRLVTIGTPWLGTRMAVFHPHASSLQLLPGSHDLDGLAPPCVPTLSIWCPDDPEIVPPNAACADPEQSVSIEGAGHLGLLVSARAFHAVSAGLNDAHPGGE